MRRPFLCLAIALLWLTALPALAAPGSAESTSGEATKSLDPAKTFAGGAKDVPIELVKEAPVERTEPPKPPNPIVEPAPRSKLPGIVVGATGGAGLGVGLALLAIGGGKGTSADALLSQVRTREGTDVVCPKAAECAEIKSLRSAHDSNVNSGRVLVGIGSAAIVVGVAYLLWPQVKPERTGKVRVAPMASPTSGGVWLTGAF
jgi:hypothetical protein